MVSDYMLIAGHCTNRNKQVNNSCYFICLQVKKKKKKKHEKQKKANFTVFVESHAFNSCLIVDMLHQLSVMYTVYLMVVRW